MIRATLVILATVMPIALAAGDASAQTKRRDSCPEGRRDNFTGPALDRSRWTTVVRQTPDLRVKDGHLIIPMTDTDLVLSLSDGSNTTPNIVLRPLPAGPFTATAKLTLAPRSAYQQAGLVIYGDDDNYIKLVFEARGKNNAESRHFEFLSDTKSPPGFRFSLSPRLGAAYPDVVWLRVTSDGKTLRGAYSADGKQFTEVPETDGFKAPKLESITTPKIGLLAMGGPPGIEAKFDWFELCPASDPGR